MEEKVVGILKDRDNWLVVSHINPDGDAVTSLLLMDKVLNHLGKKHALFLKDGVPRRYRELVKGEEILTEVPSGYSNLLVLDTSVFERTGMDGWEGYILNIDHHKSNVYFGDDNWVEPDSVAVCSMIYRLIKRLGMDVNSRIAELVYAGIYVETGGFSYSNTKEEAFRVAYEVSPKVDIPSLIYSILKKRKEDIEMMTKVLSTLTFEDGIALIEMRRDMAPAPEVYRNIESDDLIKFPLFLDGVKIAVFVREDPRRGGIRISLRSRDYDVNRIAKVLGGGGHRSAAGVYMEGVDIERAKELILDAIRREARIGEGSGSTQ